MREDSHLVFVVKGGILVLVKPVVKLLILDQLPDVYVPELRNLGDPKTRRNMS
jgi:hypothetical protein